MIVFLAFIRTTAAALLCLLAGMVVQHLASLKWVTMNYLFIALLLLGLPKAYGQCAGITKRVNPKKQRTTFYSPHYDTPPYAPLNYMRVDNQDSTTEIYLTITVLGDSAQFDPANVDSVLLNAQAVFARFAQRDSLKRAFPQKNLPIPSDRVDSMAHMMDSVLTKLALRPTLRDSLVRAASTKRQEPIPMAYRGSSLTFSDGSKLAWPTRLVDFKRVGGIGTWSNFVRLTNAQLAQLASGLISEISVYKYEQSLTKEQAEQARQVFNCMRAAK